MSKRTKVIESNVQPNPKEAEIWAKVNEDGSREVKQYNSSTGKFECCGGSGSGGEDCFTMEYYLVDEDKMFDTAEGQDSIETFATLAKVSTVDDFNTLYILPVQDAFSYLSMPAPIERHLVAIAGINTKLTILPSGEVYNGSSWLEYVKLRYADNTDVDFSFLTPITKEEFYNLEVTE